MNKENNKSFLIEKFDIKNNSLSIVSIVCSIAIILFHSYPLLFGINKLGPVSKFISPLSIGQIVVSFFFVISGFMISKSIKKSKSTVDYLKKRAKKIFPGLIITLLISVFIISPIVSYVDKWQFLRTPQYYYKYLIDNVLLYKNTLYSIPTVFENNIYPNAINGSLWTIKHTFFTYLLMIFVFFIFTKDKKKKNKVLFGIFIIIFFIIESLSEYGFLNQFHSFMSKQFGYIGVLNENSLLIRNLYYFLIGVTFDYYSDKIRINNKYLLFSIIILCVALKTKVGILACEILLPYIFICLICFKSKIKYKDISYYIYLLAFPIQQTISHYLGNKINIISYMILSVIITLISSIIMNYLIDFILKFSYKKIKIRGEKK